MRPPYPSESPITAELSEAFTPSPCLQTSSVWLNLTSDNSVQILSLDNTQNEESFTGPSSISNHLRLLHTIYSPSGSSNAIELNGNSRKCTEGKPSFVKTRMSLDSISHDNGALIDARIIFTPTSKRQQREVTERLVNVPVNGRHEASTGRRHHTRNCKSDSELMNVGSVAMRSTDISKRVGSSNQQILSTNQSSYKVSSEEGMVYVNPLKPVMHHSRYGDVKRVKLKTFASHRKSEIKREYFLSNRDHGTVKDSERQSSSLNDTGKFCNKEQYMRRNGENMDEVVTKLSTCERLGFDQSPGMLSRKRLRRSFHIGGLSDFLRRHESPSNHDIELRSAGNKMNTPTKRLYDTDGNDDLCSPQPMKRQKTYCDLLLANRMSSNKLDPIRRKYLCKRTYECEEDISSLLSHINEYIKDIDTCSTDTPIKRPRLGLRTAKKYRHLSQDRHPPMKASLCMSTNKTRIRTNGSLNVTTCTTKQQCRLSTAASPRRKVVPKRRIVKQLRFSKVTCV